MCGAGGKDPVGKIMQSGSVVYSIYQKTDIVMESILILNKEIDKTKQSLK